jgi:hypothetical protein
MKYEKAADPIIEMNLLRSTAGLFKLKRIIGNWIFPLFMLLILPRQNSMTQSLNGTTGLVAIPTAGMMNDGQMMFGMNYTDKEYNVRLRSYNQHRYYITMGYLPFLEVSLRLTRNYAIKLDNPPVQWPGDRGASVRLRFLKEKKYSPSLVLGAHDFFSAFGVTEAVWFNALYLVGSKNLQLERLPITFGLNLGYGTDRMKAQHHEFIGLFGGLSMKYRDFATIMLEYDTEKINGGMRLVFFRHVQILLALLNMNSFSGGASYVFTL